MGRIVCEHAVPIDMECADCTLEWLGHKDEKDAEIERLRLAVMTDWKDQPHWVLRFPAHGSWELADPDGNVRNTEWMGERALTVTVSYDDIAKFTIEGIATTFTGILPAAKPPEGAGPKPPRR